MAEYAVNTSTSSATNAFKWVEKYIKPSMFATPDSALIGFANNPIKDNGGVSTDIPLLGMCESFSISTGISVITLKELRAERTIVIPSKSQPGSITINRLLGLGANFARTMGNYTLGNSGDGKWRFNTQSNDSKQLFGLYIIFMSADRTQTLSTLFAERCAIQGNSIMVQAGQASLFESINIVFDKLVDDCADVVESTAPAPSAVSTVSTTGKEAASAATTGIRTAETSGLSTNNALNAALKAATTINHVKATAQALRSVSSIGTAARAVDYTSNLLKYL